MNFYRRQSELADDVRVLDRERFLHGLALDPLSGQRRAGNGRAATERLELGFFNDVRYRIDLHLQLHDVAAFRCADQTGPDVGIFLGETSYVAGIVVVIDYFIAICHGRVTPYQNSKSKCYADTKARKSLTPCGGQSSAESSALDGLFGQPDVGQKRGAAGGKFPQSFANIFRAETQNMQKFPHILKMIKRMFPAIPRGRAW